MRVASLLCLCSVLIVGGCKSRYVEATVHNGSGAAVSVVEVDYPSASFGTELLANGADYHYRFKVQGDGPTKVLWTDTMAKDHTVPGPVMHEGDEGTLQVVIGRDAATWDLKVAQK
jgi:hypothetical protein